MPIDPSILPAQQLVANRFLWISIALVIVLELLIVGFIGLKINAPAAPAAFLIIAICFIISLFYRYVRRDDSLGLFANAFSLLICGSFAISMGTYIGAYLSAPLFDKTLISIDNALGFDWRTYVGWIDKKSFIAPLLMHAYNSCNMQLSIILPVLFYSKSAHGQRVFIVLYIAGIITVLLAGFFPAVGAYVYYNISPESFMSFTPGGPTIHQEQLLALLHHTTNILAYPGDGIVSFPSYHSVMAVTLIYAAIPYRILFAIALPINIAVLLSTPLGGAHYLSDVLGGIIVTIISIYFAERILPRQLKAQ